MTKRIGWRLCAAGLGMAVALILASSARAGWEIEQRSYNVRSNGKLLSEQKSTIRASKGRVRVVEPLQTVIIDYTEDRFTLIAPNKKVYWTGSTQDYIRGMVAAYPRKRVNPAGLPTPPPVAVTVNETGITDTIVGHPVTRYEVMLEGKLFQEVWVAKDLNLAEDLDPKRMSAFQEVLRQGQRGKKNDQLAALYRNEEYLKLQELGFPMRTENFLGNAILGREATRITQVDVADSEFLPPPDFTKTDLLAVLEAMDAAPQ